MDDSIIYVRTPVGTQVARDASKEMPRGMRTLLLAVDGRTRVASYRMILSHLGDVGMLFEGLENAGYIARTDGVNTRVAPPTPAATPRPATQASAVQRDLQSLAAMTSFQPTHQPAAAGEPSIKNFDVLAKINEAQSHFTQGPNTLSNRGSHQVVRTANLNKAKSLMTDFLMRHLPDVAMEVSLSIDRIESFDELERSMPDYSQLVAKLGRVSVDHLREVRALIQR
ncbi:MAG: hypothetical protein ACRDAM_10160 [Casimicrobium sp.]